MLQVRPVIRCAAYLARRARAISLAGLALGATVAGRTVVALDVREPIALAELARTAERVVEARVAAIHFVERGEQKPRLAVLELAIVHAFLGPKDERKLFALVPVAESELAEIVAPGFRERIGAESDSRMMQSSAIWFLAPARTLASEPEATRDAMSKLCHGVAPFEVQAGGRARIPIDAQNSSVAWITTAELSLPSSVSVREPALHARGSWKHVATVELRAWLERSVDVDILSLDAYESSLAPMDRSLRIDGNGRATANDWRSRRFEIGRTQMLELAELVRISGFFEMPDELGICPGPECGRDVIELRTRHAAHCVRIQDAPPRDAKPGSPELAEYQRARALWNALPWRD